MFPFDTNSMTHTGIQYYQFTRTMYSSWLCTSVKKMIFYTFHMDHIKWISRYKIQFYHALISVGEQKDQPKLPDPLILSTGDKLINDWLSSVSKVSKLGLPQNQTIWVYLAEAHFKSYKNYKQTHQRLQSMIQISKDITICIKKNPNSNNHRHVIKVNLQNLKYPVHQYFKSNGSNQWLFFLFNINFSII